MAAEPEKSVAEEFLHFLSLDSKMLSLDCCVNKLRIKSLIDTGSSLSILHKKFIYILPDIVVNKCSHPMLKLANGSIMWPYGKTFVKIEFEKSSYSIEMYIYDSVPFDSLLGLDFLLLSKLKIDFSEISQKTTNIMEELPFLLIEPYKKISEIRLANNTIIPKRSGKIFSGFTDLANNNPILVWPSEPLLQKLNLFAFEAIVYSNGSNLKYIVYNVNNHDVLLRADTCVAYAQIITHDDIISCFSNVNYFMDKTLCYP